jgi:dTDP-4-dehydrorhamnose reductase
MKIVVLGSAGMLGHMVTLYLLEQGFVVVPVSRRSTHLRPIDEVLEVTDLSNPNQVQDLLDRHRPCIVINCAAITANNAPPEDLKRINTDLPRQLYQIIKTKNDGTRLLHMSTDGVFVGTRGNYTERDTPDSDETYIYGKTKLEGEVWDSENICLRTSIIGPSIGSRKGLLDWFMGQTDQARGAVHYEWNGVTTLELAKFMVFLMSRPQGGLIHIGSKEHLSKFELLKVVSEIFDKDIELLPEESVPCDRTLKSEHSFQYSLPDYETMIRELREWIDRHDELYPQFYSHPRAC